MDIIIQNTSGKPIYEQITAQIKNQILSGALAGRGRPAQHAPSGKGAAHQRHHYKARL